MGGVRVIRVFAVYESRPDSDRYEQHAALCRQVPGSPEHSVYLAAVE